jgi:hypothetical protein
VKDTPPSLTPLSADGSRQASSAEAPRDPSAETDRLSQGSHTTGNKMRARLSTQNTVDSILDDKICKISLFKVNAPLSKASREVTHKHKEESVSNSISSTSDLFLQKQSAVQEQQERIFKFFVIGQQKAG